MDSPVECTELCGAGHSLMRTSVRVVSASTFQTWLRHQPANGPPPIGTTPERPRRPQLRKPVLGRLFLVLVVEFVVGLVLLEYVVHQFVFVEHERAAGKTVFTGEAGCSGCHTLAAAGATGTVGPDLDAKLKANCATAASKQARGATLQQCIQTAITDPYKYLPSGYSAGIMPSNFGQRLTSDQIQALVTFLASAAK